MPNDPLLDLALPDKVKWFTPEEKIETLYWADNLLRWRPVYTATGHYFSAQDALALAVEYVQNPVSNPWVPEHVRRNVHASAPVYPFRVDLGMPLDRYFDRKPYVAQKAVDDAWNWVLVGSCVPPFIWGLFFLPNAMSKRRKLKRYTPPPPPSWVLELNGGPYLRRAPMPLYAVNGVSRDARQTYP